MATRSPSSLSAALMLTATLLCSGNTTGQSLYDELGGEMAIACWIDTSLGIIVNDNRINDYFSGELNAGQPNNLRDSLVEFACAATGGGCVYQGRDMACSHAGLALGHDAFDAFLQDLEKAAVQCRRGNSGYMPDPAYSRLNKVLLSLRTPVVQDDPGENPKGKPTCP